MSIGTEKKNTLDGIKWLISGSMTPTIEVNKRSKCVCVCQRRAGAPVSITATAGAGAVGNLFV